MRRPRQKLTVSTFPFLAVLLSAMGALILLLLVMDRRAKVVARAKLQEAQETRQARLTSRSLEEEARIRAEWQRERDRLHAILLDQQRELSEQLNTVAKQAETTTQKTQEHKASLEILRTRLESEKRQLDRATTEMAQLKSELEKANRGAGHSRSAFAKWTGELLELERTLSELKRIRHQQGESYSLVPYRGKLGEARRPIYVECSTRGLVFHPEATLIENPRVEGSRIRTEINQRGLLLEKEKTSSRPAPRRESASPYVLFLVRPDGIDHYYEALAALSGFDIDLGYELIDAHWALDIPGGQSARALVEPPKPAPKQLPGTSSLPFSEGSPKGSAGTGIRPEVGEAPKDRGANGNTVGPNLGKGSGGAPPLGRPISAAGGGHGMIGNPTQVDVKPGAANSAPELAAMNPRSEAPPTMSIFADILRPHGLPVTGTNVGGRPSWRIVSADVPSAIGSPGAVVQNQAIQSAAEPEMAWRPIKAGNAGLEQNPTTSAGITSSGANRTPDSDSVLPHSNKPRGAALPSDSSGEASNDPLARLAPPTLGLGVKASAPTSQPPLGRLVGNRDFVVTLECFDDSVALYPSGQTFDMKISEKAAEIDESLLRAVRNLVSRRQAGVRPGEPPYRPQIRFQVHPDGLRTYFRVYPLLESLRVPMTRENLES